MSVRDNRNGLKGVLDVAVLLSAAFDHCAAGTVGCSCAASDMRTTGTVGRGCIAMQFERLSTASLSLCCLLLSAQ